MPAQPTATNSPTTSPTTTGRVHPANIALAAVGLVGIGAVLGGWQNRTHPSGLSASPIVALTCDPDKYLYRMHADGSLYTLRLSAGKTAGGLTAAEWQRFKDPD